MLNIFVILAIYELTDDDVIFSDEEPQIFTGDTVQEDVCKMRKNGYVLIGYSAFNAGTTVTNLQLLEQAREVSASVVVINSQ